MTFYDLEVMNLINLKNDPALNRISGLEQTCNNLDIPMVARCYQRQVATAPNRPRDCRDPRYFVDHSGITSSGKYSNRTEEQLAVGLCRASRLGREFTIDERDLHFLDYQVPMQATRYDRGIGKIDLFGVLGHTMPCVIELKAEGGNDTPLYALIEGLTYCAIVEANMRAFQAEVNGKYHFGLDAVKPSLLLLGRRRTIPARPSVLVAAA